MQLNCMRITRRRVAPDPHLDALAPQLGVLAAAVVHQEAIGCHRRSSSGTPASLAIRLATSGPGAKRRCHSLEKLCLLMPIRSARSVWVEPGTRSKIACMFLLGAWLNSRLRASAIRRALLRGGSKISN